MPTATKALTARQRAHLEITREIMAIARRQLGEHGAAALSLRAVGRELGLTSASGLYRYFNGRDALLTALIVDAFTAQANAAQQANDQLPNRDVFLRWVAIAHAVRHWAVENPHEYALIYGTPVLGYAAPPDTVDPGSRMPLLVGQLFADAANDPGRLGDAVPVPRKVTNALRPVLKTLPAGVPADLLVRALMAWTYLLGAVSLDVFGQRNFLGQDGIFFDHEIRRIGTALGLSPRAR